MKIQQIKVGQIYKDFVDNNKHEPFLINTILVGLSKETPIAFNYYALYDDHNAGYSWNPKEVFLNKQMILLTDIFVEDDLLV